MMTPTQRQYDSLAAGQKGQILEEHGSVFTNTTARSDALIAFCFFGASGLYGGLIAVSVPSKYLVTVICVVGFFWAWAGLVLWRHARDRAIIAKWAAAAP